MLNIDLDYLLSLEDEEFLSYAYRFILNREIDQIGFGIPRMTVMSNKHLQNPLPRQVTIREVGLRDGLQSIARVMPIEHKLEWIRDAHAAGQREIEVGSFVPARLLPQLADTAELVAFAKTLPGLTVFLYCSH